MGTFGFIRYAMPLFPQAALDWAPVIATLGVIGIVYGSLMCMAQTDMKRMIAYSSVAHLGFVMLGLSALTAEAVSGAVLQMVNHGISTGALFLMIGYLYERTHTRDLSQYGGVARVAPAIAATFLVITLSSIGLPGTNGFIGEFLILIGTFTSRELSGAVPLAVAGASGVVLGAVYMLWMYQRVFFGKDGKVAAHGLADLSLREWCTVAPLLVAIVWIGFYPQPLLSAIKDPVDAFVQRVAHPIVRPRAEAQPPPSLLPAPAPDAVEPGAVQPRLFMPQRAPMARPAGDGR
jgi:NADH-quinone oxidoreductase subunit M